MVWLMSETTSSSAAAVPPGWYDDGTGSGQLRWWSGVDWTEHVAAPHAMVPERPALPADRPIYSAWIWLIVLLPLLTYTSFLFWHPSFGYVGSGSTAIYSPMSLYSPTYFAILGGSWIIYGLTALFAWRDAVWLRAQGVVRPFAPLGSGVNGNAG